MPVLPTAFVAAKLALPQTNSRRVKLYRFTPSPFYFKTDFPADFSHKDYASTRYNLHRRRPEVTETIAFHAMFGVRIKLKKALTARANETGLGG